MAARVLFISRLSPSRLEEVGQATADFPRLPYAYPFYGGLRERGFPVTFLPCPLPPGTDLADTLNRFDVVLTMVVDLTLKRRIAALRPRRFRWLAGVETYRTRQHPPGANALRNFLHTRALARADAHFCLTREFQDEGRRLFPSLADRIHHWTLGVDTTFFHPSAGPAGIRPDLLRFVERPCALLIGDSFRQESQVSELLKGSGLSLIRITKNPKAAQWWRSRATPDEVLCLFNVSFQEVRFAYGHSRHMLLLTNQSWSPAGFTSSLEAMSCSLPLLTNEGIVSRELRSAWGSGAQDFPITVLDLPRESDRARGILQDLGVNAPRRREPAERARRWMEERFSIDRSADQVARIVNGCAAMGNSSPGGS